LSMANIRWKINPIDASSARRLEYGLGISDLAAMVLVSRGLSGEADARRFLHPDLGDLGDAARLPDIEAALERLVDAVNNDDHIMVLGHDDVDGITATTIVFGSLKELGADVSYYIPDSPTEGIGLSRQLVDRFKKSGVSLIITVDCGISCKDEVAYAKSLGIDTIVTDHHEPPDELPPAVAVIDAKRHDSNYEFRELAGCGVAYRFMEAFAGRYRMIGSPPSLDGVLGMAALGSFADRVPLLEENRILVANGVKEIVGKKWVPFVTLRSHIWVDGESTMTEILAKIVPVLGASRSHEGGNLGCELLLSTEQDDAEEIMSTLIMECERKRERARRALDKVLAEASKIDVETPKVVVLVTDTLPHKTIGFCAARLADSLHKPVIIVSLKGDRGIGEARGPKGVDLVDALAANKQFFIGYGGHKQAAGFSIERSKVGDFQKSFTGYLEPRIDPSVLEKEILIDCRVKADALRIEALKSLLCLEPFGQENRRPIFLLESLHASMLKKIDGALRLNEVILSGEDFAAGPDRDFGNKMNLVVSPFGDGSMRVVEILDWSKAK
jgi:single-stranded-DNA-specific exonuclease